MTLRLCANCGQRPGKSRCSRCSVVYYCSRECQIVDWKSGHKKTCAGSKGTKKKSVGSSKSESTKSDLIPKPFSFRAVSDYQAGDVIIQSRSSFALSLDQSTFSRLCSNDTQALSEFEEEFDRWMEIQSDFSLDDYLFHNGYSSDASSKFSLFRTQCINGKTHCVRSMHLTRVFGNSSSNANIETPTVIRLFPEFAQVSHDSEKVNAWRMVEPVDSTETHLTLEIKLVASKSIKANDEIFVDILTEQAYSNPTIPFVFTDVSRKKLFSDQFGSTIKDDSSSQSRSVSDDALVEDLVIVSEVKPDELVAKEQRLEELFTQIFVSSDQSSKSDEDSEDEPSFFTLGRTEEAIQLAVSLYGENPLILTPLYVMVISIVSGYQSSEVRETEDIAKTDLMSYLMKYAHFDQLLLTNSIEFTAFLPEIKALMKKSFADDQRCVDYVMSGSK